MKTLSHPRPILIRRDEIMSVTRAAAYARRDVKTIRHWCKVHGVGRQSLGGGPLEVSRIGLDMVLHGDLEALEKLRDGKRDDPDVIRYFHFAGIAIEGRGPDWSTLPHTSKDTSR